MFFKNFFPLSPTAFGLSPSAYTFEMPKVVLPTLPTLPVVTLPSLAGYNPIGDLVHGVTDAITSVGSSVLSAGGAVGGGVVQSVVNLVNEPAKVLAELPTPCDIANVITHPTLPAIIDLLPDHCIPCAAIADVISPVIKGAAQAISDLAFDGVLGGASHLIAGVVPGDDVAILTAPDVIKEGLGTVLQGVHAAAEGIIATAGVQPIFSFFDETTIHPVLWEPLGTLTGVGVEQHPAALTESHGYFETLFSGPASIAGGLFSAVTGVLETASGVVALTGVPSIVAGSTGANNFLNAFTDLAHAATTASYI